MRLLDWLSGIAVVLAVLWTMVPTNLFIREVAFDIDGRTVAFVREVPYGPVRGRWHSEITLINGGGVECNSGAWAFANYQIVPGNTVVYQIGDWATRCIQAGPPFYITTTRQVMLFDLIPLRPSTYISRIEGVRPDSLDLSRFE